MRDFFAQPDAVALDALTRQHSTFTRQDLARFVSRHSEGAEQFANVMARVEASAELVQLGVDGRGRERFSTREMVAAEQRMEAAAARLAGRDGHRVDALFMLTARVRSERSGLVLGAEQEAALAHVTGAADLSLVVGYAGTGCGAVRHRGRGA